MPVLTHASPWPVQSGSCCPPLSAHRYWPPRFWFILLLAWLLFHPQEGLISVPPASVDQTILPVPPRQVPDRVLLIYQTVDGQLRKVPMDQDRYAAWVLTQLRQLDQQHQHLRTQMEQDLRQGLDALFAERQQRIPDLADWYFAWGTSYQLLWEAITSTLTHLGSEDVKAHVARDLERLIQQQYEYRVLQPELLDYRIQQLYQQALAKAHIGYLHHLAGLETRLQALIARQTTYLNDQPWPRQVIRLDWVSQRRKLRIAPEAQTTLSAWRGVFLTTTGALIGKTTGAAMAARMATPFVSRAVSATAGSVALGGGGAIAGPLTATAGLVIGATVGLLTDWAIQQGVAVLSRPDFDSAVGEAIASTQQQWTDLLTQAADQTLNHLFSDTQQLLLMPETSGD